MKHLTSMRLVVGMLAFAASTAQAAQMAEASPARGKAIYERRCGVCHLAKQTGAEILARRLGKERSLLAARTDLTPAYVRQVVRWGLVNMPPLSRVEMPDGDLNDVIAYFNAPKATQ
jgi:mono/diheme cytochrome c family protein